MRQSFDPGPGVAISSLAYEYSAGWQVPLHAHASDQFIYATVGAMEVSADGSVWLIPPQFALWIPVHCQHAIRMPAAVSMRTLYLRPGLVRRSQCAVLHVMPFLRELIVEAVRIGNLKGRNKLHCAYRDLLVSEIGNASTVPTVLAMPEDPRARLLADSVITNPRTTLDVQCRKAGISVRTAQRIFRRDVGTDFETWRQQVRLIKAVELLVAGRSIKEISYAVGYCQPSTFIALFRRRLGKAPRAWLAALAGDDPQKYAAAGQKMK